MSGTLIECSLTLTAGGVGAFSGVGFYKSTNNDLVGNRGKLQFEATMGVDPAVDSLTALSEAQMLICTFETGAVDNIQMAALPSASGSGFDSFGQYTIISGSTTILGDGMVEVTFTKEYTTGTLMTMSGQMPFPMGAGFVASWTYELSGKMSKKAMDVLGFSSMSGTVPSTSPCPVRATTSSRAWSTSSKVVGAPTKSR